MFSRIAPTTLTIGLLLALIYQPHAIIGQTTAPAFPPTRIVSLTLAADEMLLALIPPERNQRIVALTYLADDPRFSNVLTEAKRVRVKVRPNAERVIELQPDLVLLATYVNATAKSLLRETGIPFFELPSYTALTGIQQNILKLGQAIGENERAHALATAMTQRLHMIHQQLARQPRPRAIYYAGGNFVAGHDTSMDDIITHAGGQNIAAEAGISGFTKISQETLVALNPAHIFVGGEESDEGLKNLLLADPTLQDIDAIRTRRVHILPPAYVHTLSHHMVKCVEVIAHILHPGVFTADPLSPGGKE